MRTVIPPIRVETMAAKDEGAKTGDSQRKRHRNAGSIEAVARSRSEADWIVGMNATRAATIRLRSSFDGAVSLGRVQTPTLAILARREQEIRDFAPEPYWVVDAVFDPVQDKPRIYEGRYHAHSRTGRSTLTTTSSIGRTCWPSTPPPPQPYRWRTSTSSGFSGAATSRTRNRHSGPV